MKRCKKSWAAQMAVLPSPTAPTWALCVYSSVISSVQFREVQLADQVYTKTSYKATVQLEKSETRNNQIK